MRKSCTTRVAVLASVIAFAACANPSDKNANSGMTGDSAAAGTSPASVNASTGANVGATTTTATVKDTGRAANDSTKTKTSTSGNPTGASSTRPTKP